MTRKPIILCCSRPGNFPLEQEIHLLNMGVVLAFNGYTEPGLNIFDRDLLKMKREKFPHLPHIMPLKGDTALSTGNSYKFPKIIEEWGAYGPAAPMVYACDEPFNRLLWGCPYDPYTETTNFLQWKRDQLVRCQKLVNAAVRRVPGCNPFITSYKPVPRGGTAVEGKNLVRAYDLRHIQIVYDIFGPEWRKQFGIQPDDPVGGYLIKPIWDQGFEPGDIGPFCFLHNLEFFLYYNAVDPDICDNGRPTSEMLELHRGMAR